MSSKQDENTFQTVDGKQQLVTDEHHNHNQPTGTATTSKQRLLLFALLITVCLLLLTTITVILAVILSGDDTGDVTTIGRCDYSVTLTRRGKREQTTGPKYHNFSKMSAFWKFDYHIWNRHEKCIQISTNMPSIGSLIREIDVRISENVRKKEKQSSVKHRGWSN